MLHAALARPPYRPSPLLALLLALSAGPVAADAPRPPAPAGRGAEILHQLNGSVARLAEQVSPAVVQIEVTGYGVAGAGGRPDAAFLARSHAVGSGVIVDADGWILTNEHVVHGAQRIRVVLAAVGPPAAVDAGARHVYTARVVGTDPDVDLALLKIDARGLTALRLDPAAKVRQGELVFAVGSPNGLASTVTMGIVGSPARQVDLALPMTFVQTDAPINPGNSGGALLDVDGRLVGINSFILSQSGGSQGLGFAIPTDVASIVYDSLRQYGHVRRFEAGIATQAVTPALGSALGLPRDWGVIVADVDPGGAARKAGVAVGDVLDSIDGHAIDSLAAVTRAVYLHPVGKPVEFVVLRGKDRVPLHVDAPEPRRRPERLVDLADMEQGLVRQIGIVGADVSPKLVGVIPPLRIGKGVVVAARTLDSTSVDAGLQVGDVIHSVNRTEIDSVAALRRIVHDLKPGDAVAMQVERQGKLAYLSFDME